MSPRATIDTGTQLRIQPLGDSITLGYRSSDGNGYRLQLYEDLSGSDIQMIGSQQSGSMGDNRHEGHSGATISQIQGYAHNSLPQQPNIVLLHAGTNDLGMSPPTDPYDEAPQRLGALIDTVLAAVPNAVVLVAQIINSGNADTEARILTYNNQIPGLVQDRVNAGHHVEVVNFSGITASLLVDRLHPVEQGYHEMGDIWFKAIQVVANKGWIVPSNSTTSPDECLGAPQWAPIDNGAPIYAGLGPSNGVLLVDFDGDGSDDYAYLGNNGSLVLYLNGGQDSKGWLWYPQNGAKPIISGLDTNKSIHLADIDGDGKSDILLVDGNSGAVSVYYNNGADSTAPNGWSWNYRGQIAAGLGDGSGVRFADVDGDGRADYLWVSESGVTIYINKVGVVDGNWVPLNDGQPIDIACGAEPADVRFADLNGDRLADFILVDPENGAIDVWQNGGGGSTWNLQGEEASQFGTVGASVEFARLVGVRADYVTVNSSSGALSVWVNGCHDLAM